jgi:hypothetical protein
VRESSAIEERRVAMPDDKQATFSVPLVEHGETPFPANVEITGTAERYVGFFENRHGEQLVYVHERGSEPVLYHGDYEWNPVPARLPTYKRTFGPLKSWVTGGTLIVDEAEALWLAGCLSASGAVDAQPAQAIATQLVDEAMKEMDEMPAEKRDEMMREARAEVKRRAKESDM